MVSIRNPDNPYVKLIQSGEIPVPSWRFWDKYFIDEIDTFSGCSDCNYDGKKGDNSSILSTIKNSIKKTSNKNNKGFAKYAYGICSGCDRTNYSLFEMQCAMIDFVSKPKCLFR